MTSLDAPTRVAHPGAEDADRAEADEDAGPADADAAPIPGDVPLRIATGAFTVLFLAETVGWVLVLQGVQAAGLFATGSGILDFIGGLTRFLVLIAAPLWFVAVVQLTRELRTRRRLIRLGWLALGAGLLVPWPFLLGFLG